MRLPAQVLFAAAALGVVAVIRLVMAFQDGWEYVVISLAIYGGAIALVLLIGLLAALPSIRALRSFRKASPNDFATTVWATPALSKQLLDHDSAGVSLGRIAAVSSAKGLDLWADRGSGLVVVRSISAGDVLRIADGRAEWHSASFPAVLMELKTGEELPLIVGSPFAPPLRSRYERAGQEIAQQLGVAYR